LREVLVAFRHTVTVQVWDGNSAGCGWTGFRGCAGRGGSEHDFSNFCGWGLGLNFAGVWRSERKISTRTWLHFVPPLHPLAFNLKYPPSSMSVNLTTGILLMHSTNA